MRRAMASMSASVCSATEMALPPGVFITRTPAAVAASRSTLSTPTPARPIDRKSTRLNSSHLGISYAVFCLKLQGPRRRSTLFPYAPLFRSSRCVHHQDAGRRGGFQIYVVDTHARAADYPQPGRFVEHRLIHLHSATHDQRIRFRKMVRIFLGTGNDHVPAGLRLQ